MILDRKRYEDKVRACWVGKNIGGTLGGPYEHREELLDVRGFATAKGEPLPNDDLDLQLVWLYALEQLGPGCVNANTLGEFWLNFVTPYWNEYGIGKANMQRGLLPGISGDFQNHWQHSNGAWIRTEIWACVAPGLPNQAARFAVEDAKVDHGAGEGTYAAAFVAAMQAAAFVTDDLRKCIEVGLAAIPENCRIAKTISLVMESYDAGRPWKDTRNAVLESNMDLGTGWFEAPSNVGYAVLGMLYGEGDFKRSMLTAINCGDDTDCTAATVGATLGILYGTKGIPADWAEYIGDSIITISLSLGDALQRRVCKTCTELTDRVVAVAPGVLLLHSKKIRGKWLTASLGEADDIPANVMEQMRSDVTRGVCTELKRLKPYTMTFRQDFVTAEVTLNKEPVLAGGEQLEVSLRFANDPAYENRQYPLVLRWILPEGFRVSGTAAVLLDAGDTHGKRDGYAQAVITAPEVLSATNRLILEVTVPGRHTALYCSFPVFSE